MNQDSKKPLPDFNQLIQIMERRDLDSTDAQLPDLSPEITEKIRFIRIAGIAKSLPYQKAEVERYLMEDVLSGLYGSKIPFIYLILGSTSRIGVYIGVPEKQVARTQLSTCEEINNVAILISALQSTYPNIEIELLSEESTDKAIFQFLKNCRHFGIMTGIPTPKLGIEEYGVEQIERLIRGVYQHNFGYMVIAIPITDHEIIETFDNITSEIRNLSAFVKETRQVMATQRVMVSGESINRQAQYYIELLEIVLDKLKLGKAQGMWRTQTYYFSPDFPTFSRMSNLLKVVFSGEKSLPEPIRTLKFVGTKGASLIDKFRQGEVSLSYQPLTIDAGHPMQRLMKYKYTTILNSRDLATLTHLPKEEMPGYNVKDIARFGVHPPDDFKGETLKIGIIIDRGLSTGNDCILPVKDLVKHGAIVGVTGSGKTNTVFNLLFQLWNNFKIPFLVIEPAKGEYRTLSQIETFPDLQIFTLGDETTAPFRLNPFEIMDSVRVQSHIDHLRAVFNASFVMYAPMPYVLERCIHEIYQDKGWDLITGENRYKTKGKDRIEIFPTLTDLYEKIDSVVDRLGYEEKITMDVKAALKTRIGSLRIGGKGAMLDTPFSVPMEILLAKPTILELHTIGDDEEKAFIIGLILARLYEFREAEKRKGEIGHGLRHITVIEEAHRLLTRTPPETGNLEVVNIKAKAVEAFCNILSEIRAFGEGILIAEQIPSKIAPDAIKNSNLKIVHRLVAKDDRDLLGTTMNLSEEQNRYLALLEPGFAVVFYEGLDDPFLLKVPYFPSNFNLPTISVPPDERIREFMTKNLSTLDHIYGRQRGCELCSNKCRYLDMVKQLLEDPETEKKFSNYLLAILENKDFLTSKYEQFKKAILDKILLEFSLSTEEIENLILCFLITAGNRFFHLKKTQYNLSSLNFNSLVNSYLNILRNWATTKVKPPPSSETEKAIEDFQEVYKRILQIEKGPYPGCDEFCKYKCLFRFEVKPLAENKTIDNELESAIKLSKMEVREFCFEVARKVTMGEDPGFLENIALCFFIQKSFNWGVKKIIDNIRKWFII
jgi:hypothetical protein